MCTAPTGRTQDCTDHHAKPSNQPLQCRSHPHRTFRLLLCPRTRSTSPSLNWPCRHRPGPGLMRSVIAAYQMRSGAPCRRSRFGIKASSGFQRILAAARQIRLKQKNPLRTSLAHGYDLIPLHFYQARRPYAAGFLFVVGSSDVSARFLNRADAARRLAGRAPLTGL